jgi:hypothetical protein
MARPFFPAWPFVNPRAYAASAVGKSKPLTIELRPKNYGRTIGKTKASTEPRTLP